MRAHIAHRQHREHSPFCAPVFYMANQTSKLSDNSANPDVCVLLRSAAFFFAFPDGVFKPSSGDFAAPPPSGGSYLKAGRVSKVPFQQCLLKQS
jgi:hypothetical protein